jgi:hypothetical protein
MRNSGICRHAAVACFVLVYTFTLAQNPSYITLEGKQFYDQNGAPFFPMVMNYHVDILNNGVSPNPDFKAARYTSYGSVGCASFEGGYTWTNCESSIEHDFQKIKEMGFNSIRLIMTPSRKNGSLGFRFYSKNINQICPDPQLPDPGYEFNFSASNYYTADAVTFFNLVGGVLDIAWNMGLHVIYLCSDHSGKDYDDRFTSFSDALDYANYLSALAYHLKDKPALLAYDLYNEPGWVWWEHNISHPLKFEICSFVNMWYDSIHQHDDNHLITLGGTDFGDAIYYDGTTMKLDFISMHLYPNPKDFQNFNQSYSNNRVIDMIYWCSNALQRPWIIGESGFSTAPDACINNYPNATHGTYSQQSDFVNLILPAIRDCGGSGFSWWCFQDRHHYCIPGTICTSVTHEFICDPASPSEIKDIHQNYFGLLEYGDPDLMTGDPYQGFYPPSLEKPTVNAFRLFDPTPQGACQAPTSQFFNPFNHPSHPNEISGVIVDDDTGQPIEFAVVIAKTVVGTVQGTSLPINHWHYTFANDNGEFTIIPYDYLPSIPNTSLIDRIELGASGAEAIVTNDAYTLSSAIGLRRDFYPYDEDINNLIVYNGQTTDLRGYNTLTAGGNIEFRSGSVVDMSARREIQIQSELTAFTGSEVHIFTDEMFPDCVEFTGFREFSLSSFVDESEAEKNSEIELRFKKSNPEFEVEIRPNPGYGLFHLESPESGLINARIEMYNSSGSLMFRSISLERTFLIDIQTLSPGVYTLMIRNTENQNVIRKVVKY